MAKKLEEDFSLICKALGHPARLQIVRTLLAEEKCMSGDIAKTFDLAPSTVSEHLRILKEASLISSAAEGTCRCYCVNRDTLNYWKSMFKELNL